MLRQIDRAETQGATDWARYWKVEAARHLLGDAWSTGDEDLEDFCERVVGILKHDIHARKAGRFHVVNSREPGGDDPSQSKATDQQVGGE